jgi:hypothetical protein
MKTILTFERFDYEEKVILRHSKDVKIYKEIRTDHMPWTDGNGNRIKDRTYIVIRYPKSKPIDLEPWKKTLTYDDRVFLGFVMNDLGDEMELLFYDWVRFAWEVEKMEKTGLFRVRRMEGPNFEENGTFLPIYLNPQGLWEWGYNIVCILIQLPFMAMRRYQKRKSNPSSS